MLVALFSQWASLQQDLQRQASGALPSPGGRAARAPAAAGTAAVAAPAGEDASMHDADVGDAG